MKNITLAEQNARASFSRKSAKLRRYFGDTRVIDFSMPGDEGAIDTEKPRNEMQAQGGRPCCTFARIWQGRFSEGSPLASIRTPTSGGKPIGIIPARAGFSSTASGGDIRRGHTRSCGCQWFNGVNPKSKAQREREALIRAFFTTGLFPQGDPNKKGGD